MQKTLFIADLHLIDERDDISQLFVQFLQHDAIDCDALYILGDLFEVWVGDDNKTPFNQHIAKHIKVLSDTGVPIYFIHGNRDFSIGKKFAKQSGMILLPESHVIDLYGTQTLIMHGDSLCTLDIAYQKFRKKSRNKWWLTMMLCLPLSYRKKIARQARERSQLSNQGKTADIMDVTQSEVELQMSRYKVQLMIHGHTHRPNRHLFSLNGQQAERIVLGDWYDQGSILQVTPDSISLLNQQFSTQPKD